MSILRKRVVFYLGIFVLIGITRLVSGQTRVWLTLFLILVLSLSMVYVIGADYVRSRQGKDAGTGPLTTKEKEISREIAKEIFRRRGRKS